MCGENDLSSKIYPAKNIDDAARPRSRLSGSNWTRALSAKRPGHCTRQVPVFVVEMPVANIVGQADNLLVDWQHHFWNRTQARGIHHRISVAEMERCSFIFRSHDAFLRTNQPFKETVKLLTPDQCQRGDTLT
jgi:hypothetical protein